MATGSALEEAVREARARTGIPGVAAGLWRDGETLLAADGVLALGADDPVLPETPFRIASISKSFTATLAARCSALDEEARFLLSHTAGLRCESTEPLPAGAEGLFSYSNAGYWKVGARCADACGTAFEEAMRTHVLEPLGLGATGFTEPARHARGHVQEGETGHRTVLFDSYPPERRPSGGLWSTVADLLRFGREHLASYGELHEPQVDALGAHYALGWWVHDLARGGTAIEHEGSVAGYQSLLLLAPDEAVVLAVLTNSWRGSGLVVRVVEALGLGAGPPSGDPGSAGPAGTYALDGFEAIVTETAEGVEVEERELDPVTGTPIARRYPARSLGGGVFGAAGGRLMSHRQDFPRPGFARLGWVVLPRVSP